MIGNVIIDTDSSKNITIPADGVLKILMNEHSLAYAIEPPLSMDLDKLLLKRHEYFSEYGINFRIIEEKIAPKVEEALLKNGFLLTRDSEKLTKQTLSYPEQSDLWAVACSKYKENNFDFDINLAEIAESLTILHRGQTITISPAQIQEILVNEHSTGYLERKNINDNYFYLSDRDKITALIQKRIELSKNFGYVVDKNLAIKLIKHIEICKDWHTLKSLNKKAYSQLREIYDLGKTYIGMGKPNEEKIQQLKINLSKDQELTNRIRETLAAYDDSYAVYKFLGNQNLYKIAEESQLYFEDFVNLLKEITPSQLEAQ